MQSTRGGQMIWTYDWDNQ